MKKSIFLTIVLIALGTITQAQDNAPDYRYRIQYGLKGGVNYSNVYDTQGEEFQADPKFGLVLGGFISVPIGKFFGIHPELLYSQKGFKATGKILGSTYEFTRTTSYLAIPILFALKPSQMLTIVAGPEFSYLLKQKDVFANATTSIAQEQEFENDNIRKNTFGFLGGIDINYYHLVIGGRVGWDITKNNGDGTSTTPRYKNVWYQLTLGYKLFTE